MTPQELKEIEARANEATEGPWGQHDYDNDHCMITAGVDGNGAYIYVADVWDERDIPFIAHARSDIPNLLAHIAALTERLRAVEAERDEVQRNLELYHEVVGLIERDLSIEPMSTTKTIGGELSALRAELQRKDAVILNLYQFAEHSDACWRDEVSRDRPCVCGLDNALKEADVELQPKEPPCQTA